MPMYRYKYKYKFSAVYWSSLDRWSWKFTC